MLNLSKIPTSGHQNAKLFITHGGMLGNQEAIYHAVPILGLPLCNDQRFNIAMAMKNGIGLKLDWGHIDEKSLYDTIVRIIGEPRYLFLLFTKQTSIPNIWGFQFQRKCLKVIQIDAGRVSTR